jgi:hypothetical protein
MSDMVQTPAEKCKRRFGRKLPRLRLHPIGLLGTSSFLMKNDCAVMEAAASTIYRIIISSSYEKKIPRRGK